MRMGWLAAGIAIGALAGAAVPVIAFTPLIPADLIAVGPGRSALLGCMDAAGGWRQNVQADVQVMSMTGWVQIFCPP